MINNRGRWQRRAVVRLLRWVPAGGGSRGGGNDVIAAIMPAGAHDCGNHVVARVTADGSGGNGEEGGAGVTGEVLTLTPGDTRP